MARKDDDDHLIIPANLSYFGQSIIQKTWKKMDDIALQHVRIRPK